MMLRDLDVMCEPIGICAFDAEHMKTFNGSTHTVSHLFVSCLGKLETRDVAKVVVVATCDVPRRQDFNAQGVLSTWRQFDFTGYWDLDNDGKKRRIFEFLSGSMLALASQHGWSIEQIEQAHVCMRERNLRNVQWWPRSAFNRQRGLKARVMYDFDVDELNGYAVVTDRKGHEVDRKLLFTLLPSDFFLYQALGKLRWSDERTVELTSRLGDKKWTATF